MTSREHERQANKARDFASEEWKRLRAIAETRAGEFMKDKAREFEGEDDERENRYEAAGEVANELTPERYLDCVFLCLDPSLRENEVKTSDDRTERDRYSSGDSLEVCARNLVHEELEQAFLWMVQAIIQESRGETKEKAPKEKAQ